MKNITMRRCELSDGLDAVAELIVETDAYIYPPMFSKCEAEARTFFKKCLADPKSAFYHKNILLACNGEKIFGILIAFSGVKMLSSDFSPSDYRSGVDIQYCDDRYFKPLFAEYTEREAVTYISNVCVKESARNCGIGGMLMASFLREQPGVVELDVLCENPAALHLYQKNGFSVLYSEQAFSFEKNAELRSCRMQRAADD